MQKLFLKNNSERKIRSGYLWVFSNELQSIPKLPAGSIVELVDYNGKSFGYGFYNPNSLISVRLLKYSEEIDFNFFKSRILSAKNYREQHLTELNNYRLIFGESDFLPGLVVDKFENSFVIQILSAGIEHFKSEIVKSLIEIFPDTDFILSKSNSKLREMEGLQLEDEVLFGKYPVIIQTIENKIKLEISLEDSQKTGYYLDQRYNRYQLRKLSKNKKVLDCFTNQGGFALNAAFGGASEITAVDSSVSALKNAERNAEINNFKINFVHDEVFNFLENAVKSNQKWDIVVLDPPAFTKNKKSVPVASAAYSKLNKLGLKCVNSGGYLVTSSCSQHIREEEYFGFIKNEAGKLKYNLKLLYRGTQPPDHPVLISMPETSYLKFFICSVTY